MQQKERAEKFNAQREDSRVKYQKERAEMLSRRGQYTFDTPKDSQGNLTELSSADSKAETAEVVYNQIADFFFDKVSIISYPFTQVTNLVGKYTSTTLYGGESRLTDTAEGRFLAPGKQSRMKCQFYLQNPDALIGYILSPVIYDSFATLNTFSSMSIFRSYLGLKFNKGVVTVAVKEAGKDEQNYPTSLSFKGAGSTDTVVLEIMYNGRWSEVYLNSVSLGTFNTDFITGFTTTKTFLSLLAPAISTNGTGVNIIIENFQYLQIR